ncbi:MAG: zinc-binding dehydrogenase [Anaerolineae bacterium]|nr:zinc-binding dehydrogenase [Anaerolineae bacterium]
MKAAVIEANNILTVKDVPEPAVGDYDALVDILYGATCTGTDQSLIKGTLPFRSPLPTILGHESIGRVIEVGPKVRYLKAGDLVTRVGAPPVGEYSISWGGFSERGIAKDYRAMDEDGVSTKPWPDARRNRVLPAGSDPAAATMIITWRETLSYITRMGFAAGKTLLVVGSGGNGLAYINQGTNLGGARLAMIGSPGRKDRARRAGATDFFDYKADDLADQVTAAFPEGFHFIIDAVGMKGSAEVGLTFLKKGGTLGIYGLTDFGQTTITPLRSKGTFTFYNGGYDEAETHEQVMELLEAGKLDATIWLDLDHVYPLERINDAFADVEARRLVKAVVRLGQE